MRAVTPGERSIKIFAAAIIVASLGYLGIHKGIVPGTGLDSVEQDLQLAARTALQDAGIGWVSVTMTGQQATLSGTAPDAGAAEEAAEIVRKAVWAGGLVAGGITKVDLSRVRQGALTDAVSPVASPFTWTATLEEDGSITIAGFVPDEQVRLDLAADVRTLFETVPDDRTVVARGAPDADWSAGARAGLTALALLDQGVLTASDTSFALTGTAPDATALAAARDRLAGFPLGLSAVERVRLAGEEAAP